MVVHKREQVVHLLSTGSFFEFVGEKSDLASENGVGVQLFLDDIDRVHDGRVVLFVEERGDLLLRQRRVLPNEVDRKMPRERDVRRALVAEQLLFRDAELLLRQGKDLVDDVVVRVLRL